MSKTCFNSNCKEASDKWRRGWRCRTGEYADLCDGCASAYEEGNFCEMFHLNTSGWRCCESCGKQIHCGCIVSFHMFILLDAGGIECLSCAKNNILTPNPAWPPPPHFVSSEPEKMKDISMRNWSTITGSGPTLRRQAPSLLNGTSIQFELQPRTAFEVDMSGSIDRFRISERLSTSFFEKKEENSFQRLIYGKLRSGPSEIVENRNAELSKEEQPNPSVNVSHLPSSPKNDSPTSELSLIAAAPFINETNDIDQVSATLLQPPSLSTLTGKQIRIHNGIDSSGEARVRNGKSRGDGRGRNQLLPRYWPRITDKELQKISSDASDAGRVGRLVLPKKCAEAYFPPISQPEGLPLKVHDLKGKEWLFQFRFWPNNNSRMYVLEGITPCIQSMQLQAGDVVTFSRLEPEGKLVMGGRKASTVPSYQGDEATVTGDRTPGDDSGKNKFGEVAINGHIKGNLMPASFPAVNPATKVDLESNQYETDKPGLTKKEILENKSVVRSKRKNSIFSLRSKRLRIDNEEMMELKLTCNQAQGLMRSLPENIPSVFVVEGCEIEEFEDAPIIGRPTIPAIDRFGEKIQWVECEDCFKWRKVPANALLPSRWTCSGNVWGLDRSLCSTAQQLTTEQLEDILSTTTEASKEKKITEQNSDLVVAQEGLDALANLAIQGDGMDLPPSPQTRTKHAGRKLDCTCTVCIQPSDGNDPKHKQTCDFADSESLKHHFRTLMERCEKKQLAKEAESACQKLHVDTDTYLSSDTGKSRLNQEEASQGGRLDDPNERKSSVSPLKGQIDLNIQPEREDLSPGSDSGAMKRLLEDATENNFMLHRSSSSSVSIDLLGKQMQPDGIGGACLSNCIM